MLPIIKENPPPINKDKVIRIKYVTQLLTFSFAFFCNLRSMLKKIIKILRKSTPQTLNFEGVY